MEWRRLASYLSNDPHTSLFNNYTVAKELKLTKELIYDIDV